MLEPVCDQLDAYLAGMLTEPEQAAFTVHLRECAACRGEAADAERVVRLLARASKELERCPPNLVDRIGQEIGRAGRADRTLRQGRTPWLVAAAAAAAVLLCFAAWSMSMSDGHLPHGRSRVGQVDPRTMEPESIADSPHSESTSAADAAAGPKPVDVRIEAEKGAITVPIASRNANITIVWMYVPHETAAPSRRTSYE